MSPVNYARSRSVGFWLRIMGVVVIVSFAVSIWTVVAQSQASAERAADRKARVVTEVGQCFQQVRNAPQIARILEVIDILATNSIKANQQALEAAAPGDPLRKTRLASLARLVPARQDLRSFIRRTKNQAPTEAACNKLAAELGVNPSKLKR